MSLNRKIALFSTSFLPFSQTFIYDEIRAHSENYELTVFCKNRLNEDRFPWDQFHKPGNKYSEVLYEVLGYRADFNRIIRSEGHDLIHAHFGNGAVYALPYVKKQNKPFVVTFHGNDVASLFGIQKYQFRRWRYVLKSKQIFKHADILLAASEELKSLLIEVGAPAGKVHVYQLGIDLSAFPYRPPSLSDTIRFIMIGRFTAKKGHIYALKALKEIIDSGKDAHLTLVGSGELESSLKNYIETHGLTSHVEFTGVLTPDEVSAELKNSDVLLAPSVVSFDQDRESGLIVAKEASAVGLPVIGTWHGGIHEIIEDQRTGFLVPERNVPELKNKMLNFIENRSLVESMGIAARKKMEAEYDLYKQVQKLEEFYERAITSRK